MNVRDIVRSERRVSLRRLQTERLLGIGSETCCIVSFTAGRSNRPGAEARPEAGRGNSDSHAIADIAGHLKMASAEYGSGQAQM